MTAENTSNSDKFMGWYDPEKIGLSHEVSRFRSDTGRMPTEKEMRTIERNSREAMDEYLGIPNQQTSRMKSLEDSVREIRDRFFRRK